MNQEDALTGYRVLDLAGVVHRAPDTIEDPQIKYLGALVEPDHPVSGRRRYPSGPFKMISA